jgi:hypothetical protein
MRSLTTLEAQFLRRLKVSVMKEGESRSIEGVFITETAANDPSFQIGLKIAEEPLLVYFDILIYGSRPVRYHLKSAAGSVASKCRPFWNRLLGPMNLVMEKSGEREGHLHLFYEVCYPDKELRKLGEK